MGAAVTTAGACAEETAALEADTEKQASAPFCAGTRPIDMLPLLLYEANCSTSAVGDSTVAEGFSVEVG